MGFKTIESQEELDALIKDRIERERKTLSDKYADYDELKKRATDLEAQVSKLSEAGKAQESKAIEDAKMIEDLNSKIKSYETDSAKTRIALELGLPYELAGRLTGVTEDEIRKDAEAFAKFVNKPATAPIGTTEPSASAGQANQKENFREILKGLNL